MLLPVRPSSPSGRALEEEGKEGKEEPEACLGNEPSTASSSGKTLGGLLVLEKWGLSSSGMLSSESILRNLVALRWLTFPLGFGAWFSPAVELVKTEDADAMLGSELDISSPLSSSGPNTAVLLILPGKLPLDPRLTSSFAEGS
jgi:hypothetical protein